MQEPVHVPSLPPDLVAGADISWARLITGVMLLVLSLVMGYRGLHRPPPPKAEPHPVRQQLVVRADLPPMEAEVVSAPRTIPYISAAPPLAQLLAPPLTEPLAVARRAQPARESAPHFSRAVHRRWSAHAHARRYRASRVVARNGIVLTRAQVEREYFRSRDLVAAFGGEDSGSVYLARVAAERRLARFRLTHRRVAWAGPARG